MIHSKAMDVLKTFTKEELKQFNDFVRSPFHNKNKKLIKLFDVLKNYHPDFDVENEKLYSKVYPEKKYNYYNMKKLMSEMLRLCDNFLILILVRKEKFASQRFLSMELLQRKVYDYFLLRIKNFDKMPLNNQHRYYNDKAALEDLRIDYHISRNNGLDTSGFSNKKFIYDTCYFLFQVLDYIHNVTVMTNTYNSKTDSSKFRYLIESLDIESFTIDSGSATEEERLLCLLSNLIKMTLNPDNESYFFSAKKIFLNYFQKETCERCNDYMLYFSALTSYCTRKIRQKKLKYIAEEFELNKKRFSLINRFNDNVVCISWSEFAGIVLHGLDLNQVKWIEDFIIKSKRNINGNDYDYLKNYGRGSIEFHQGNFEKALEYFSRIFSKEHLLNIAVRNLILMCYYELNLFEPALSGIDSFRHLIHDSNKFNTRNRSLSKYFINIYGELLRLKEDPSKINNAKINKINIMLEAKEFSFTDKWFIKKTGELKLLKENYSILKKERFNKRNIRTRSA